MEILNKQPWLAPGANGEVRKDPAWKEAVTAFIREGFKPSEPVLHSWFFGAFGIIEPDKCGSVNEAQRAQLAYLGNMEALKKELLEEHQIALRSVRGVGYEIVPPTEQTQWAQQEIKAELGKAVRTGRARLINVQLDMLTDEQKKENMDAQAKLSFFKKSARKALE